MTATYFGWADWLTVFYQEAPSEGPKCQMTALQFIQFLLESCHPYSIIPSTIAHLFTESIQSTENSLKKKKAHLDLNARCLRTNSPYCIPMGLIFSFLDIILTSPCLKWYLLSTSEIVSFTFYYIYQLKPVKGVFLTIRKGYKLTNSSFKVFFTPKVYFHFYNTL